MEEKIKELEKRLRVAEALLKKQIEINEGLYEVVRSLAAVAGYNYDDLLR